MPDPFDLEQESALSSFLKFLGRPGYAARNLLKGNIGGTVRQLADIPLDVIDSILPGDLLPQLSGKADFTEASDLAGGMEPGWMKTGVDIVGGIATDPLTYTGIGVLANPIKASAKLAGSTAANLASKTAVGTKALDYTMKGAKATGDFIRHTSGNLMPSDFMGSAVTAGKDIASSTSRASQGYIVKALAPYDAKTQKLAIHAIRGVTDLGTPGTYRDLGNLKAPTFISKADQMTRVDARIQAMGLTGTEAQTVRSAAETAVDYTRTMWKQGLNDKVFNRPSMWHDAGGQAHNLDDLEQLYNAAGHSTVVGGAPLKFDDWAQQMGYKLNPVADDFAPFDYLPGKYEMDQAAKDALGMGTPSVLNEKTITDSTKLAYFLNNNKASLGDDLGSLLGDYGTQMGRATGAAKTGDRILPGFTNLVESRSQFKPIIEKLREAGKTDDALLLETHVMGMPAREGIQKFLGEFNANLFKKFATAGAFIPRPAFTTRNVLGSVAQAAAEPGARQIALNTLGRVPGTIMGAWGDGLRKLGINIPQNSRMVMLDDAIAKSGGSRDAMIANLAGDVNLQDAVRLGVIDGGYVSSEMMQSSALQQAQGMKSWRNWMDWPQEIVRGSEQRMRLGMFDDLRSKGVAPEKAAGLVNDTLYDYAYEGTKNRLARDIIPFAQFTFKAVPQQAKMLASSGAIPSTARNLTRVLYNQGQDSILPPQLQDNPIIPVGNDEQGNPKYLTSFGMPWEALTQLPNLSGNLGDLGGDIRQKVVSSMTPAIKFPYSWITGRDPFFDSNFGSYDKAPYAAQAFGADPNSEAARIYNLAASSGLIQPLSTTMNTISGAVDPRMSAGEALLNTGTGFKVKSVDEDQALQQLLQDTLEKNPRVQRYETLYQKSSDEDTQAMLEELRKIKATLAKKRKEARLAAE